MKPSEHQPVSPHIKDQTKSDEGLPIGEILERVVAEFPDQVALRTDERDYTYSEFNYSSNRVAHTILMRPGNKAGRVALLFNQGANAILSIFGVLKTGNAFVTLDSTNPMERLKEIIRDCEPFALITDNDNKALAESVADESIKLVNIDALNASESGSNPKVKVSPDEIAYICYTSGSTGKPKGVLQTHRNLYHFVRSYSTTMGVMPGDRLSMLYSLSFSASNMDVFGALLTGATLCPYDIKARGIAGLADWVDSEGITVLHAVPTVFRHLMGSLNEDRILNTVRSIDLAGEAAYPADLEAFKKHFSSDCLLVNHLAATEASVIAQSRIRFNQVCTESTLPVGQVADGVQIQICREDGSEIKDSEPGELIISSPYLSPGYWKLPELTASTFPDDTTRPGQRIYRTGDLVYRDGTGDLYHLGRKDSRVKIRGHSVDISEVEAGLSQIDWIEESAVLAEENPEGPVELVAYLSTQSQPQNDPVALRKALSDKLASYMIPSRFVFLNALPLTATGKIDRRSLSGLQQDTMGETSPSEPPRDKFEKSVADLFADILEVETVGRKDDFFLLGGDSLKATKLHAHLQQLSGQEFSLQDIIEDGTVAGLADRLRSLEKKPNEPDSQKSPPLIVPLRESGSRPPLFLVHGAHGAAFVSPHFLEMLGEDQPAYAFQISGLDRSRKRHHTIEGMAEQYCEAIQSIQAEGPYFLGSLCIGSVIATQISRLLEQQGQEVGPLLFIDPPPHPPRYKGLKFRLVHLLRAYKNKTFYKGADRDTFAHRLTKRRKQGRISFDHKDDRILKDMVKAAYTFEIALLRHSLKAYKGPVLLLASERWYWDNKDHPMSRSLTGEVQTFDVGGGHLEIHDVHNETFGKALSNALQVAHKSFENLDKPKPKL